MPTSGALDGRSATARAPQRPEQTEPALLEVRDAFHGDLLGANAIGSATAEAARGWGIWWVAGLAARAALVEAMWLLRHEHPDGILRLRLSFDSAHRELTIVVCDVGSMLPVLHSWDELRTDLCGTGVYVDARHLSGNGRELTAIMRIRPPYRVRLNWNVGCFTQPHPPYTFQYHETEQEALQAAEDASRGIGCGGGAPPGALLRVEHQGPGDGPNDWRPHNLGTLPPHPSSPSPAASPGKA